LRKLRILVATVAMTLLLATPAFASHGFNNGGVFGDDIAAVGGAGGGNFPF
jgi:hypothetical protein